MQEFLDGFVKYPDTLPCPQVDTDLVPRERRYISDITDVRNMRMFQQEFQATRNRISFIFTEEEAREFREWYENDIIYGGAWFYADWPTLHKDKKVAHRFVGQPKWEWLLGANPGAIGRSSAGWGGNKAQTAVTMYKVTATVELYERLVGKGANVFTSKLYPLLPIDSVVINTPIAFSPNKQYIYTDSIKVKTPTFTVYVNEFKDILLNVDDKKISFYYLYGTPGSGVFDQYFNIGGQLSGSATKYIYSEYNMGEDRATLYVPKFTGVITNRLIVYDYYTGEGCAVTVPTITFGVSS